VNCDRRDYYRSTKPTIAHHWISKSTQHMGCADLWKRNPLSVSAINTGLASSTLLPFSYLPTTLILHHLVLSYSFNMIKSLLIFSLPLSSLAYSIGPLRPRQENAGFVVNVGPNSLSNIVCNDADGADVDFVNDCQTFLENTLDGLSTDTFPNLQWAPVSFTGDANNNGGSINEFGTC
jgi:hypothetical protein